MLVKPWTVDRCILAQVDSTSSGESAGKSAHPRVCASHAKRSSPALQKQRKRGRLQYAAQEDNLLMRLKKKGLPWILSVLFQTGASDRFKYAIATS